MMGLSTRCEGRISLCLTIDTPRRLHQSFRLARGLRLRRSARRAGAAGESSQRGHGRGAGRRRWVGSREKWLYFSYTPELCGMIEATGLSPTMVYGGWQREEVTSDSQMYIALAVKQLSPLVEQTEALR